MSKKIQEESTENQIFDIWLQGFNINFKPDIEVIYSKFLENNYNQNRKQIFEKLTEDEQKKILQMCQEKANSEQIFSI